MGKYNQYPNPGQQSVKMKAKPLQGPSFESTDFAVKRDVHIVTDDQEQAGKKSTPESSKILSTAELISGVGKIWDSANRALACLRPRARVRSGIAYQKDSKSYRMVGNDDMHILDVLGRTYLHVNLNSSRYTPCMLKQSLDHLKLIQEISYKPCDDQFIQMLFPNLHDSSNENNGLTQISPFLDAHTSTSRVSKKIDDSFETALSSCNSLSGNEVNLMSYSKTRSLERTDQPNLSKLPSGGSAPDIMSSRAPVPSLHSDYLLQVENTLSVASMSTMTSDSAADLTFAPNRVIVEDDDLLKNRRQRLEQLDTLEELHCESRSSATNQPHAFVAKQEHAVSGALAGTFVSLCLHPIDTVKTVVQSCRSGPISVRCIGQSLISERGLSGLYRGITSNITASAPISAIYTFTYESVKGFLLPSFSKEYHSLVHCTGGACASIATSFIFTPSEHIKQQMQVHSQYKNCWNAVYRIIEKGGLPSLYAGWGAVLCRNIPHSIIKFYTYESLKQVFMSSDKPNRQPHTLHTLLCGGLAGSTAALFSTPFDVVKTRLQTQIPGSMRRYDGILGAFQDICEQEGVKGLYRGLIPRLVMYMSQGALFFASYELFKSLLSIDIPRYERKALQSTQDMEDDPLLSL